MGSPMGLIGFDTPKPWEGVMDKGWAIFLGISFAGAMIAAALFYSDANTAMPDFNSAF